MKKKVKDLTMKEYKNICNSRTHCEGCPFQEYDIISDCRNIKTYIAQRELKKILNQEVEVVENEEEN